MTISERARRYLVLSRYHRHSLLFALPLLALYEGLEIVAPVRLGQGVVRNGAEVMLTSLFTALVGWRGPALFMAIIIGVALTLVMRDRASGRPRLAVFAMMAAEAVAYALVFGVVIGTLTRQVLGPVRPLVIGGVGEGGLAAFTLSLGAGLYEELLFRVILVALLARLMRALGVGRLPGGAVATLVGAVVFSLFHYVGPLGEPFALDSFVFRALAGLGFSALYLLRGFGITAWTHAIYDVLVLM